VGIPDQTPVCILPLPIHTKNLLIRCLEERDLEDLYALEADREVKRYVGGPVRRPMDEWTNCMRDRLGPENCTLAIELIKNGSFVGRASIGTKTIVKAPPPTVDIECELQILVVRKYWGKHFGREVARSLIEACFALVDVSSIVAIVDPEHAASRKLMDIFGFQYVDQKSSPGSWDDKHMVFRLTKPHEMTTGGAASATPSRSSGG
jgi:RimJ/RimL family protein N-acetyltransferase